MDCWEQRATVLLLLPCGTGGGTGPLLGSVPERTEELRRVVPAGQRHRQAAGVHAPPLPVGCAAEALSTLSQSWA